MILEKLKQAAEGKMRSWAQTQGLTSIPSIAWNAAPAHVNADISLPWPLVVAKEIKRKPLELAAQLAPLLKDLREAESAEAVPPGFVNIRLSHDALTENLLRLIAACDRYGENASGPKRNILIEFVSANPTGPVHLASGRAATLGDSLARILRRRGHKVGEEFYVNDMGKQVEMLGLSVKARYEQSRGNDAAIPEGGYQGDYIKEVAKQAPPEAAQWSATDFSRFAIERMLAAHQRDMTAFGVRFDRWFRESELHAAKALDQVITKLKTLGHIYEKDSAVWLGSSEMESEDDKDRVLVRSDGRPTYFLGDIAYHQNKFDRGFTELIDIWGADHHGYVPRMRAAIEALGYSPDSFHAIIHQLVHLYRGKVAVKMSKRAGEFITLRELVEEVGLDACRFFFALRTPNSHMNFDLELAKQKSQENPVYYVQYVHARICSLFREAAQKNISMPDPFPRELLSLLKDSSERALMVKLTWFPEALRACERELSPHPLANYLMELAGLYHPFYERRRVVDPSAQELSRARLTLCAGARDLIAQGLGLLGVSAPQQM